MCAGPGAARKFALIFVLFAFYSSQCLAQWLNGIFNVVCNENAVYCIVVKMAVEGDLWGW